MKHKVRPNGEFDRMLGTIEWGVRPNVEDDRMWRGTLGFAVLRCCSVFLCGIPVNKIPHFSVAVISNPTVRDVWVFKPTVFGETKLFAVLRHQQYQYSLHADHALWTVYRLYMTL